MSFSNTNIFIPEFWPFRDKGLHHFHTRLILNHIDRHTTRPQ